jgi:prophage regulatory protein
MENIDMNIINPNNTNNRSPLSSTSPIRILRLPEVMKRVGLKHSAIYDYMSQGSFPKQIRLGGNAVGWLEHEIEEWIACRIRARPTL